MPLGRPPAATRTTALERLNAPTRPAAAEVSAPVATLTGQPLLPPPVADGPGLPPGSYPSPWFTDGPGCCGPLGRNGRIGYEIYAYTGPAWSLGEGRFARQLETGWMVGGGGASLFFNTEHDAAWVVDLGLSYQYNRGTIDHFQDIFLRRAPLQIGNTVIQQPDVLAPTAIRGLHRTNFNFGLGRDWWFWGPGSTGLANGWNLRLGALLGGRWGTAHVDMIPQNPALGDYSRRQGVTHGIFVAPHATVEVPLGTTILFGGLRVEYGYDWMNLIPPQQGNLHNINLLMTAGLRF
jgi:hypothetical protein